jgi:hypothetical protein
MSVRVFGVFDVSSFMHYNFSHIILVCVSHLRARKSRLLVRFLLAFARSDQNREGESLGGLSQYPSKHWMSGLRSVEELMQGPHRLFLAILGRLNSCFTLEQAGGEVQSPDLVLVAVMALEAQHVPWYLLLGSRRCCAGSR